MSTPRPGPDTDPLAATYLFRSLRPEQRSALADRSLRRRYRRGHRLFEVGDPSDSLVVVLAGRLQVTVDSADGGELMLTVVGPGGVLGELGIVDGGGRSAAAATLEDSEVLLVPRAVVLELVGTDPQVARQLLTSLAASLRRLTDATADLVFLDLPRRLAKLLLDQPRSATGVIELGLTQGQVAARIGGTRQSVNSALGGFERRRWLHVDGSRVALLDLAALQRFAGV